MVLGCKDLRMVYLKLHIVIWVVSLNIRKLLFRRAANSFSYPCLWFFEQIPTFYSHRVPCLRIIRLLFLFFRCQLSNETSWHSPSTFLIPFFTPTFLLSENIHDFLFTWKFSRKSILRHNLIKLNLVKL